jgi:hypothetical protein
MVALAALDWLMARRFPPPWSVEALPELLHRPRDRRQQGPCLFVCGHAGLFAPASRSAFCNERQESWFEGLESAFVKLGGVYLEGRVTSGRTGNTGADHYRTAGETVADQLKVRRSRLP